jgi:hypothetical protein
MVIGRHLSLIQNGRHFITQPGMVALNLSALFKNFIVLHLLHHHSVPLRELGVNNISALLNQDSRFQFFI